MERAVALFPVQPLCPLSGQLSWVLLPLEVSRVPAVLSLLGEQHLALPQGVLSCPCPLQGFCGAHVLLTGGTLVSLVAFDTGFLTWLKAMGTTLSLVHLTLPTSSEPELSLRLL